MRYTLWLLIALAAMGSAQWRHFGAEAQSPALVRDMLAGHNGVRAEVGLAPLAWSDHLAAFASLGRLSSGRRKIRP